MAQAAEHARALLTALGAQMAEGLALCDREGAVLHVNPAMVELLGAGGGDARGRPFLQVLERLWTRAEDPDAARDGAQRALEEARSRGQPASFGCDLSEGAGVLDVRVCPLEGEEGHVWIVRDASGEAAVARLRAQLVSELRHAMQSPLTTVLGFLELLAERDYDPAVRQRYVRMALEQVELLSGRIDEVLGPYPADEAH